MAGALTSVHLIERGALAADPPREGMLAPWTLF